METAIIAESTNAQLEEFVLVETALSEIQRLILASLPDVGPMRTSSTASAESACWALSTTHELSLAIVGRDGSEIVTTSASNWSSHARQAPTNLVLELVLPALLGVDSALGLTDALLAMTLSNCQMEYASLKPKPAETGKLTEEKTAMMEIEPLETDAVRSVGRNQGTTVWELLLYALQSTTTCVETDGQTQAKNVMTTTKSEMMDALPAAEQNPATLALLPPCLLLRSAFHNQE